MVHMILDCVITMMIIFLGYLFRPKSACIHMIYIHIERKHCTFQRAVSFVTININQY